MTGDRGWPNKIVLELRGLLEQGLSASQIGAIIGKTRNAVIGKAHRLGLGKGKTGNGGEKCRKVLRKPAMNRKQTNFNLSLGREKVVLPPVAARPAVAPIVPVNGNGLTILELRRKQCHAVIGSSRPENDLPRYCGHPTWGGTPYCEGHYAAFHTAPKPR